MSGKETKSNQERGRPTGIKVLSIILFLISLFYLLKLSQVILQWSNLENLQLTTTPFYLAADSIVWCVSAIILAWGIWVGRRWAGPTTLIMSFTYSCAFWIDRIWIAEPEGLAQRWPINLLLTILGLGMILLIINRKSSRDYFRGNPAKIP